MALGGSGGPLGDVLAQAVGAPSSVSSFFQKLGGAIADWAPGSLVVMASTFAAAGGNISGVAKFRVVGTADALGALMAGALQIPPDAAMARAKWREVAQAIIDQFTNFGVANGTGLVCGSPATGKGTVLFTSGLFVPPLALRLEVSHPVAAAGIEAFGAMLLSFIASHADVVGVAIAAPFVPITAPPPTGPVTGEGSVL